MEAAVLLRCGTGMLGAAAMLLALRFHVFQKLTSGLAVVWEILGLLLVLTGCLCPFSAWTKHFSPAGALLFLCLAAFVVGGAFRLCISFSRLSMQSRELAAQVSLLLEENERLSAGLRELQAAVGLSYEMEGNRGEKASVCHKYPGESRSGNSAVGAVGTPEELRV